MKYKYSAFTENSKEMREWLESIGYEPYSLKEDSKLLLAYLNFCDAPIFVNEHKAPYGWDDLSSDFIDCRSNPPLFKAVTAVRSDSDYMQWFKERDEVELIKCDEENFDRYFIKHLGNGVYWKATLSELQDHFKIEKK